MDVKMPERDGIDAIRRFRADPKTQDLTILSLTAMAMDEERERYIQAGADDYLSKPVGLRTLLAKVEELSP